MKIFIGIIYALVLVSFNTIENKSVSVPRKITVIVLPPYDKIASRGGSPFISREINKILRKDSAFKVLSFPKSLMGHFYAVYDKKYCKEIIDTLKPDIIIMSKLDLLTNKTDKMANEFWRIEVKAYFPGKDSTDIIYSNDSVQNNGSIEKDIEANIAIAKLKK